MKIGSNGDDEVVLTTHREWIVKVDGHRILPMRPIQALHDVLAIVEIYGRMPDAKVELICKIEQREVTA